jgi:predicted nucleic acid-binding protein
MAFEASVALYLDTSCLLKMLFPEPESARVLALCAVESRIVVSSLAKLEAAVQINARYAGGTLTRSSATRVRAKLDATLELAPYESAVFPPGAVEAAEQQLRIDRRARHCRTLDRLHLAAVEVLGLVRILTSDDLQARAAAALGYEVLIPRLEDGPHRHHTRRL